MKKREVYEGWKWECQKCGKGCKPIKCKIIVENDI